MWGRGEPWQRRGGAGERWIPDRGAWCSNRIELCTVGSCPWGFALGWFWITGRRVSGGGWSAATEHNMYAMPLGVMEIAKRIAPQCQASHGEDRLPLCTTHKHHSAGRRYAQMEGAGWGRTINCPFMGVQQLVSSPQIEAPCRAIK